MDKKTYSIGILSLMAVVLLVANFMPLRTATAADAIKDRDIQLVTARVTSGGEALYIADSRTGLMAVFTWDTAARAIKVRDVRPVTDAFAQ